MTEDSYTFYCGAIMAASVAMQVATLMFEGVRRLELYGGVIFFVTSFVVENIDVSWRVRFAVSSLYFMLTMCVGEYFSRRRTRRHRAKMAEYEREFEDMH